MPLIPVRSPEEIRREVDLERARPEAAHYDPGLYFRHAVTADVVLFTVRGRDLKVLLIQRKQWPFAGRWALPGGFVRSDEGLDEAARRELREETSVADVRLQQLAAFGDPHRDPRSRVITVAYFALLSSDELRLRADTDARRADWWSIYNLPALAFDHDLILDCALERLRGQIWTSDVARQLMPRKFTLTALQSAYEVVLGRALDKRNFRKKVLASEMLEPLEETHRQGAHRPARLYRFRQPSAEAPAAIPGAGLERRW